ncbi:MAG: phosphotransferase [Thermodesulfobacteriota bacterium]
MPLLPDLLSNWSVAFARKRPDLAVPGSPERCLFRHVVEDASGGLWLLEQLAPGQAARREAIGQLLDGLASRGLHGLAPYRRTASGSFVCRDWGHFWQLSHFIQGVPLVQPDFLDYAAKGAALGGWLAALRRTSAGLPVPPGLFALDLPAYAAGLVERIGLAGESGPSGTSRAPGARPGKPEDTGNVRRDGTGLRCVHARASALLPALAPLFEAWPHLPRALCHGDVHPMNVIWGGDSEPALLAVIDWEFAGVRPALYDMANCLGCLLIEGGSPDTPFARSFLSTIRAAGLLPGDQESLLPSMILATRFGWLSEWLRRRDDEMIDLELDFMERLAARGF